MRYGLSIIAGVIITLGGVGATQAENHPFIHPGMLSTHADFATARKLIAAHISPAIDSWQLLQKSPYASATWQPHPLSTVVRGNPSWGKDNYSQLYQDAAAAYQLAVRWEISGDPVWANAAVRVLDAWANTLTTLTGTSDRYLAAGIYGYELANAAEIMRTYPHWAGLPGFQKMMLTVFYPMNRNFLLNHNGHGPAGLHYWANWDLANLASMMAIGILTDRHDIYREALDYIKSGPGNGNFNRTMWHVYPDGLAQIQESGRDQGHATLDIAFTGILCQMAWNQGDDLFGYRDNLVLKGAEYVARYNLGDTVPWTNATDGDGNVQTQISPLARGTRRPIWTLIYNHYSRVKGLNAPYSKAMMEYVGVEGGGGNYGPNSGGFDQLGFGSLLFNR